MSLYCGFNSARIKKYTQTTGTVIDYEVTIIKGHHSKNHTSTTKKSYAEIAEFEVDGTTYTVTNQISTTYGVKQIGDSVQIAYNPDDPNECIFITPSNNQAIIIIFALGVIFAIAGSFLLYYFINDYKKWKKSNVC